MSWGEIKNIDHAAENGDVILHVNQKDEPVLVEILNASQMFRENMRSQQKSVARRYTKPVPSSSRRKKLAVA